MLLQTSDIFMSHDWPGGVKRWGDLNKLYKMKPFLKKEVEEESFGSAPCEEVMKKLQPGYWFSGHMHCKFSAKIGETKFLALDKCLKGREFMQVFTHNNDLFEVIDVDAPLDEGYLRYDAEWLAIEKITRKYKSDRKYSIKMPDKSILNAYDL